MGPYLLGEDLKEASMQSFSDLSFNKTLQRDM